MTAHHSLWTYISGADPVVKTVMLILLIASIISWTFIIQRACYFKYVKRTSRKFETSFWSGVSLSRLYTDITAGHITQNGLATIFAAGFKEFIRLRKEDSSDDKTDAVPAVQRAMRVAYAREAVKLEKHLPFLASVGSISPYIGLFGTVWGIMSSFHALGSADQSTMTVAMVAPGISEALIATAMGLFAAIPAVLAYNRYTHAANSILDEYETFQDELLGILDRQ